MKLKIQYWLMSFSLMTLNVPAVQAAKEITIPFSYAKGQVLYDMHCSSCHGQDLTGTEKGPPLLHPFYKPSHHGDAAFYKAALKGARAHHWDFGDMQPVQGMTKKKMDSILPYIRFYQQKKNLY